MTPNKDISANFPKYSNKAQGKTNVNVCGLCTCGFSLNPIPPFLP